MPCLRIGSYGENGDYAFGRTVIPEDSVGFGRALLRIRLKNLLPVRTLQTHIFMGLEAKMPRIRCQELDGLFDSSVTFSLGGRTFEPVIGFTCLRCPL
jgi:hypothetical protein